MSIIIKPIKIKTGFYLLIPKTIAELINLKDGTKFKLTIKNDGKKIIQYIENKSKRKIVRKVRKKTRRRK